MLQKSFDADLLLKKHFLLLSMLTQKLCCSIQLWKLTIVLGFFDKQCSKAQHVFEIEIFCNIINVFILIFDPFNAIINDLLIRITWKIHSI